MYYSAPKSGKLPISETETMSFIMLFDIIVITGVAPLNVSEVLLPPGVRGDKRGFTFYP